MSTPVGTLRQAAALMREQHGPEHVRHRFWRAVAQWLDFVASDDAYEPETAPRMRERNSALAVARAYLSGEAS